LSLLLAATNAQAAGFDPNGYEPARGSTEWKESNAVTREPIDYQMGYGTKTTITELPGGRVDVQQHMGNGYDEIKVIEYSSGVYEDYGDDYDE
jgi:hypothetical protein